MQVNFRSTLMNCSAEELNDSKYQFVKDRITRLWPEWRHAAKALEKKSLAVRNRQRKNVSQIMEATQTITADKFREMKQKQIHAERVKPLKVQINYYQDVINVFLRGQYFIFLDGVI